MEQNYTQLTNFTYNIACIRKHYGISKKRMAQLLGIGIGSLTKLEHGEIPPGMTVVVLLRAFKQFRISPSIFLEKRLQTDMYLEVEFLTPDT